MSPDGAHAPVRVKFDVESVRREFPILEERIHERPLVYLDNANTTQKPKQVLEALDEFYRHQNANIHRATHLLSRARDGRPTKAPAPRSRGSSGRARPARSSSPRAAPTA